MDTQNQFRERQTQIVIKEYEVNSVLMWFEVEAMPKFSQNTEAAEPGH
jgi:hypothetical protein